jgi:integrase
MNLISEARQQPSAAERVGAANAVRLQLLTGARLGEVLQTRKDAFDLERGLDPAVPGERNYRTGLLPWVMT